MKINVGQWFLAFIIALAAILIIGLSACKVKNKSADKSTADIKTEQTTSTTAVTVIDTIIKVGGDTAALVAPMFEFLKGDTLLAETNGTKIMLQYDKKTNTVKAAAITKEKYVPVKATKTETKQENTKTAVKTTAVHKQQTVKSDVGSNLKWLFWLFLVLAIIVFLVYQYLNKNFPFNLF